MSKLFMGILLLLVLGVWAQEDADANYLQMRRTACLVLSRYHSNTQKDAVEGIMKALAPVDQPKYVNKLYAVAVQLCEEHITQSQVTEFYTDNTNFDPTVYYYLLESLDYNSIADDLEITKEQEIIVKFAKKFDEDMQIRQEERQAQEKEGGAEEKYEMKFLGFSIKDLPQGAKLAYVGIFAAVVIAALWYGLNQLDNKTQKTSNKRRKSPKKDSTKKD